MSENQKSQEISGEALDLLVGLLEAHLGGTQKGIQISLTSKYSLLERVNILKEFILEHRITNSRFAEPLAEYYITKVLNKP